MKKWHGRTHPLEYDTKRAFEIRVTEKDCDLPNCPNNQRTYGKRPDWPWYLHPQPLQPTTGRQSKLSNQSVLRYLVQSLADSSISGVNKVSAATNCGQRLVWTVVLVFCLCGFGYQTFGFLRLYYRKPSVVQIEVENDGLADFPAVTLCNTNRFRKSEFCSYLPQRCPYKNITLSEAEMGDVVYKLLMEKNTEKKYQLGHSNDMLQDCIFNGFPMVKKKECREMLDYFYDPDYGNCYTIPSKNLNGHKLEARESDFWQEANDLTLLIDLEVEEMLERKRHPGIVMTVHDDSFFPDMHTDGIMLGGGESYNTSVYLLPPPYKTNCTDYEDLPWSSHNKRRFTSRICTVGCSQYYQLKKCNYITKNLSLFFEELPFDPRENTEEHRICAEEEEMRTQDFCRSICGLPCRDTVFEVTVGSNVLSEKEMLDYHIHSSINRSWEEKMMNLAVIKIYFTTLEHKIFRHMPKYDTMELFSYLGGYSGVWLGFSLLTVYELIEILFSTTRFAFQKHQRGLQIKKLIRNPTKKQGMKNFKKRRHFK